VWVANDTRLNRRVAIKMLAAEFAADRDLQTRFRYEAQIISGLSHPNICTLFDVGEDYIVMELLHGETLSSRIAHHGPLPLRDVVRYGAEIADALEAAHRCGVVHRDLKPGNVMITKNGAKLLDFGLAKSAIVGFSPDGATDVLTRKGMIVGTLQHMAPEQLEGRRADHRADIWALGTVLYEMITGRAAFDGSVPAAMLIAAIERFDPTPMTEHVPGLPPALDHVVHVCLQKEPDARWQSAHDVAEQLRWMTSGVTAKPLTRKAASRRTRLGLIAAAAAGAAGAAAVAVGLWLRFAPPKESLRAAIDAPEDIRMVDSNTGGGIDISPDGRTVVFAGRDANAAVRLYLRGLDSFAVRPLAGTEGASYPFWSPRGDEIGFFAAGKLKRIATGGGAPADVADAPDGRGGDWSSRDEIVFAPTIASSLLRVSARGGEVRPVTRLRPGEQSHRFPSFFPDGEHLLYYATNTLNPGAVYVASLAKHTENQLLLIDASAHAAENDRIVFVHNGALMTQRIDLGRLALTGEARQVAQDVGEGGDRRYQAIAAAGAGILLFVAEPMNRTRLTLRDRSGKSLGVIGREGAFHEPALDSAEKKVVLTETRPGRRNQMWEVDLERGRVTRLALESMGMSATPVLTPDSTSVLFYSPSGTRDALFELRRGTSVPRLVTTFDRPLWPNSISRDGTMLVLEGEAKSGATKSDLWLLRFPERRLRPLLASPANESHAQLSPDGRLIAYSSDELGRSEIFVQTVPPTGGKWQVTSNGGDQAQWRGDGGEIFYLGPDARLYGVRVQMNGAELSSEDPKALFATEITPTTITGDRNQYVAMRDGQRFLLLEPVASRRGMRIGVITNWH